MRGAGSAGLDEGCEIFFGECIGKALHDFRLHDVKRGGVVAEHSNGRAFGFAQGCAGVFLELANANGEGGEQGLHDGLVFGVEIRAYFRAVWLWWQLSYMLGDAYTIVDMVVWGWARAVPFVLGAEAWGSLPHVKRLLDEINLRQAAQRAEALKAQHAFKAEMDDAVRQAMFPQNARLGK